MYVYAYVEGTERVGKILCAKDIGRKIDFREVFRVFCLFVFCSVANNVIHTMTLKIRWIKFLI